MDFITVDTQQNNQTDFEVETLGLDELCGVVGGYTGAEKSLITLIAVGVILVGGKIIPQGTSSAASAAADQIRDQRATTTVLKW